MARTTPSEVRSLPRIIIYCSRVIRDFATRIKTLRKRKHRGKPWNWNASIIAPLTAYFYLVKRRSLCKPCLLGNQFLANTWGDEGRPSHMQVVHSRKQSSVTAKQNVKLSLSSWPACAFNCTSVYNDHKALVMICKNRGCTSPARTNQWALRAQPYHITVKHRRGAKNLTECLSWHVSKSTTQASCQQKAAEEIVEYLSTKLTPKSQRSDHASCCRGNQNGQMKYFKQAPVS